MLGKRKGKSCVCLSRSGTCDYEVGGAVDGKGRVGDAHVRESGAALF